MTREEQIKEVVDKYFDDSSHFVEWDDCGYVCDDKDCIEQAFIEGAKWADKTMIDKACECLKNSLYDTQDNCGYKVVASFDSVDVNEFIEQFKRAMEE